MSSHFGLWLGADRQLLACGLVLTGSFVRVCQMRELEDMGFPAKSARWALRKTGGDLDEALGCASSGSSVQRTCCLLTRKR